MLRIRAQRVLEENVRALMRVRGYTIGSLARSIINPKTGRPFTTVWLSNILKGERGLPISLLDKIADRLGVETYQLLQPGAATTVERRRGKDRRTGAERRTSPGLRALLTLDREHAKHPKRATDPFQITGTELHILDALRAADPSMIAGILQVLHVESTNRITNPSPKKSLKKAANDSDGNE